jgi:hypothetical protein
VARIVANAVAAGRALEVAADGATIEQDEGTVDAFGYCGVSPVPGDAGIAFDDFVGLTTQADHAGRVAAFACARPKILLVILLVPIIRLGLFSAM